LSNTITRREALWRLGSVVGGGAAALAGGARSSRAAGALRPNIIFILADDLGYGDLGCYGQTQIRTPNLDAMAAGGMRFTDFHCGAAVCRPSRCSLLTGFHTGHTTIRRNEPVPLRSDDLTVAELLKSAGYTTGVIGKWQLGASESSGAPWLQGFDDFFGYSVAAQDYYPTELYRNARPVPIPGNEGGAQQVYAPDLCTTHALSFIRGNASQPFFLFLSYTIPHANVQLGQQTGNGMQVPSDAPYTDRPWPQVEKNFAAMITRLDGYVGRLLRFLRAQDLDGRTLVLAASDNGPHSQGGHSADFFHSGGPLRGGKDELYEGGIRVPMIAYWPGHVPSGVVSDKPTAFWDFLPTAAELAGAAPPAGIDGISMVRTLLGETQHPHDYLYWESYGSANEMAQAVRMGKWKGLRPAPGSPLEVYDLSTDLGETTDVAAQFPGVVARISDIMLAAHAGSTPRLSWSYRTGFQEDAVEPDMGLPNETSFHFEVRVLDLDGDEPDFVRLTLYRDGTEWSTRDLTRSDSVTRRGRRYSCVRRLSPGNYAYIFTAADIDGGAALPLQTPKVGPVLPCYPYLVWTGESGYEDDGVEPHTGDAGSTPFRFRVKYRAHDGDYADYVQLTLWRDGALYQTCQMKPSPHTDDPVAGMVYFIARLLPAGDYEYQFGAADQHGKALGPASARMGGLTVARGAAAVTGLAATPTHGGAEVTFSLSAAAQVSVDIANLAGRPVATVTRGTKLPEGLQTVVWNGMSTRGLPVPSGTYIVRVAAYAPSGAINRAVTTCSIRR
jgi:arylsulfatase A-like enzyme